MRARSLCSELDELLIVDESALDLGVFVAYTLTWKEREVNVDEDAYRDVIEKVLNELPKRYSLDRLKEDPIVRAYRDFYWRIGIDPTKTRPASEALVRRVLRGSFPRINAIVDAGNLASIKTLVPIGLYDLGSVQPPFKLTLSRGGEFFRPIGGKPEVLPADVPVLMDSRGVVMHVYPHRDSRESMITESTSEVLVVAAGVPSVPGALVREAAEEVVKLLARIGWGWCGRICVTP